MRPPRLPPRHRWSRPGRRLAVIVFCGMLVAAPWMLTPYEISLAAGGLALVVLALSVHLHTGVAGLPTLGQAAPYGVGAYTAAVLARDLHLPGIAQLAAAAAAGAVLATITGLAVVRTRGITTIMITLAVVELTHAAAVQSPALTGGTEGLPVAPTTPWPGGAALADDRHVYLWLLAVTALTIGTVTLLQRSPFGRAVAAIGDNETRMTANGYPVAAQLWTTHVICGGLAGLAGSMWITAQRYISPAEISLSTSALALIAVVIGGLGSAWGAAAGALVVVAVRDYLGGRLDGVWTGRGAILLGAAFVICVYALPHGIAGHTRRPQPCPPAQHAPVTADA